MLGITLPPKRLPERDTFECNHERVNHLAVLQDDGAQAPQAQGPAQGAGKAGKAGKAERAAAKAAAAAEAQAEARRVAELQLLMMDDDTLRRPSAAPAAQGVEAL